MKEALHLHAVAGVGRGPRLVVISRCPPPVTSATKSRSFPRVPPPDPSLQLLVNRTVLRADLLQEGMYIHLGRGGEHRPIWVLAHRLPEEVKGIHYPCDYRFLWRQGQTARMRELLYERLHFLLKHGL